MARYRQKDETDLAWNKIRRQITRDLDTRIMNFREELLNELLTDGWTKYVAALETGTLVELQEEATAFVETALTQYLKPELVADGDVEGS